MTNYTSLRCFVFSSLLLPLTAIAGHDHLCEHAWHGDGPRKRADAAKISITSSGRDEDVFPQVVAAANKIFGNGGIAETLGLAIPDQKLLFLPAHELSNTAAIGRPPVYHYMDGLSIMQGAASAAGVLEFVSPACSSCRSYYSDTTSLAHQLSIMFHVAGHNDFSVYSPYLNQRKVDQVGEALKMDELLRRLYVDVGYEEVALYYQRLESTKYLQDLIRGSIDAPESFVMTGRSNERVPKRPTASVIQFLSNVLPGTAAPWQRELTQAYERTHRIIGGMAPTKLMNEGWATLMQEILAVHSPWIDSHHVIEYMELMQGVAYPSLSNPYWLGREAWRRVRARFIEQNSLQNAPALERDQKFIKYAHTIIASMSDFEFLQFALDEEFVSRHGLHIRREVPWYDRKDVPGQTEENNEQYEIVSTDPKEVALKITQQYWDYSSKLPRIKIENVSAYGRGVISLVHDYSDGPIPLHSASSAQTLFVMAQIWRAPVSVKTAFLSNSRSGMELKLVRTEVSATGRVTVTELMVDEQLTPKSNIAELLERAEAPERPFPELTAMLQQQLDQFMTEEELFNDQDALKVDAPAIERIAIQSVSQSLAPTMHFLQHAPNVASALDAAGRFLQERAHRAMLLLKNKKIPYLKTARGVQLKIVPTIPTFAFNSKAASLIKNWHESQNSHFKFSMQTKQRGIDEQDKPELKDILSLADSLGSHKGRKQGDRYWAPGPKDGEDGEGEADDADKGEQKPGEPQKPDEATIDPSKGTLDIPFSLLPDLLDEPLELPRLRPLAGRTPKFEEFREGATQKSFGEIRAERTIHKALPIGRASLRRKGIQNPSTSDSIREGLRLLSPSDLMMYDHEPEKIPDINAVVVFGRDTSGSMMGMRNAISQEFVWQVKGLLHKKYRGIEFRYVGFSDTGIEMSEKDFFNKFINGGTSYAKGFEKSKEIIDQYPASKWDRFFFVIGDMEDFDPEQAIAKFNELKPETSYIAAVETIPYQPNTQVLSRHFKQLDEAQEYVGFASVMDNGDSLAESLRHLFSPR